MQTLLIVIKNIVGNKKLSLVFVLLAFAGKIIQLVFFYNIRSDASYQLIATDNLLHGFGLTVDSVNLNDFSQTIYEPLLHWPPGFSLIIAPFYILFDHDYIAAGIAVDILAAGLLIVMCRAILKILNVPLYLVNICTLVNGFFIYEFYSKASSDDVAISLMLVALLFCLRIVNQMGNNFINVAALVAFLLMAAFTKYLFVPVAFIIPLFLVMHGHFAKKEMVKKAGIAAILALTAITFGLFFYQYHLSNSVGYISSTNRGFFPENLLRSYPFIIGAFINPNLISGIAGSATLYQGLQLLNAILLLPMLAFTFFLIKKKNSLNSIQQSFFLLSGLLSAGVVGILAGLSLVIGREETFAGIFWTYVEEGRYFGLAQLLIQLCFFVLAAFHFYKLKRFLKTVFILLSIILFFESLRGAGLTLRRVYSFNKEEYSWQYEDRLQRYADTVIQQAKQQHPSAKVIVTGSYYNCNRFRLYSHVPVLYHPEILLTPNDVKSSADVIIIKVLHDQINRELISHNERIAGKFEEYSFYIQHVRANK